MAALSGEDDAWWQEFDVGAALGSMATATDDTSAPDISTGARVSDPIARQKKVAACQRYRNKRRAEEVEVRARHTELSTERVLFERRIAELQTQLQTVHLTHTSADDERERLEQENALLQTAVRKQRILLRAILDAAHAADAVLPEERISLLRESMDAGPGQVVGLAYTSVSWRHAPRIQVAPGRFALLRYQLLPLGSTRENARRVNYRVDYGWLGAPASLVHAEIAKAAVDPAALDAVFAAMGRGDEFERTFHPFLPLELTQLAREQHGVDLHVHMYKERHVPGTQPVRQALLAASQCARRLSPHTFFMTAAAGIAEAELPEHMTDGALKGALAQGPVECFVSSSVSCQHAVQKAALAPTAEGSDGSEILAESMLDGILLVPHAKNAKECFVTVMSSLPIGFFGDARSCEHLLTEDGAATPLLEEQLRREWNIMYAPMHGVWD